MAKRIISIIVAILVLASLAVPATAASSQNEARDGLIMIYVVFEDTNGGIHYQCVPEEDIKDRLEYIVNDPNELGNMMYQAGSGTGFFVAESETTNPQYIVTCEHVVDLYTECGKGEVFSVYDINQNTFVEGRAKIYGFFDDNDYEELYVVDDDAKKDVAILKLAEPTNKRKPLALLPPTDGAVGNKMYVLGYPGMSSNDVVSPTKISGISAASVKDGIIGKLFVESGSGTNRIETTCDIQMGHSGGPAVDEYGNVIGINALYVTDYKQNAQGVLVPGEKNKYCVNISEAIGMLKNNNIAYTEGSIPTPDDGKKDDTKKEEKSDDNNLLVFIIIGIAAVVVIGAAVVIVIVLKKKNKPAPVNNAPQSAAPVAAPKSGYVRSLAMQHRGMRVKLQPNNQIIIGRSKADCAVIFKEGTPGVSGRHCSVSYDPASNEFTVIDLGSSFGTFLQNGTKLTSGISHKLREGDRFYLGEQENMIVLEVE